MLEIIQRPWIFAFADVCCEQIFDIRTVLQFKNVQNMFGLNCANNNVLYEADLVMNTMNKFKNSQLSIKTSND
jgi:hypothetical protein